MLKMVLNEFSTNTYTTIKVLDKKNNFMAVTESESFFWGGEKAKNFNGGTALGLQHEVSSLKKLVGSDQ